MTTMLRVKAVRDFGHHRAKDELLVEENSETKLLVKRGYFELLAVEKTESKAEKGSKSPDKAPSGKKKSGEDAPSNDAEKASKES